MESVYKSHSEILKSNKNIHITIEDFNRAQRAIGGEKQKSKKTKLRTLTYTTCYGESVTRDEIAEASKRLKISEITIRNRIVNGEWSKHDALNVPKTQGVALKQNK